MTQKDFGTINPTTKSGTQLAADLNDFRDALNTKHSGAARPSYVQAGMEWLDTSAAPIWTVKLYDGSDDVILYQIDTTNNIAKQAQTRQEVIKTADYTLSPDDAYVAIIMNKSSAAVVALPALSGTNSELYFVKNIAANPATIDPNASETIEGGSTVTLATGESAWIWPASGKGSWRISKFVDGNFYLPKTGGVMTGAIQDATFAPSASPTKKLGLVLTAITAGVTRLLTIPNRDIDLGRLPLFALLQDQKSAGTNGGTPTATGSWQTRTLNTEVRDPDGIVTLSSNVFTTTVPCIVRASAGFYQAGNVALRIYDTANLVEMFRSPQMGTSTASGSGATPVVEGFLPAGSYALQYLVTTATANIGLGPALNAGTEVYASVSLQGIVT